MTMMNDMNALGPPRAEVWVGTCPCGALPVLPGMGLWHQCPDVGFGLGLPSVLPALLINCTVRALVPSLQLARIGT